MSATKMFKLRDAVKEDCIAIESLIKGLGDHVNRIDGPEGLIINRQVLERDGFGQNRVLFTIVAEDIESKVLFGYALYFFKFSTHYGKSLYLEDLFVKSDYRGSGAGRALLTAVTKEALRNYCHYTEWCSHPNNLPSHRFYLKFGAQKLPEVDGWVPFKLDRQQMESIVNKSDKNKD